MEYAENPNYRLFARQKLIQETVQGSFYSQ